MYCFKKDTVTMEKYEDIVNRGWFDYRRAKGELQNEMRAKMFLSFEALTGLREDIDDAGIQDVEKKHLTKDYIAVLNGVFENCAEELKTGDEIFGTVFYFVFRDRISGKIMGDYKKLCGIVSAVDATKKCIVIDDKEILFSDICDFSYKKID